MAAVAGCSEFVLKPNHTFRLAHAWFKTIRLCCACADAEMHSTRQFDAAACHSYGYSRRIPTRIIAYFLNLNIFDYKLDGIWPLARQTTILFGKSKFSKIRWLWCDRQSKLCAASSILKMNVTVTGCHWLWEVRLIYQWPVMWKRLSPVIFLFFFLLRFLIY